MEISGNKYLHKKFKKQTSCSLVYNAEDKNDNGNFRVVGNVDLKTDAQNQNPEPRASATDGESHVTVKDNKNVGNVPNYKSTNCDSSLVINTTEIDSPLTKHVNKLVDNQSSISNLEISVHVNSNSTTKAPVDGYNKYQNTELTERTINSTSLVTNSISTTTSSLANDLRESSSNIRNFSFDTQVNITEPNNFNSDKSSILNTPYSKSSLISNVTTHKLDMDDTSKHSSKTDTDTSADNINEKKQQCGDSPSGKYVCMYCNLACSKPSVLQKHIRAHTNERPYPCVSCGFSFKTRSNLYKHCRSRTHANRIMGNKHMQSNSTESQDVENVVEKMNERLDTIEECTHDKIEKTQLNDKTTDASNIDKSTDQKHIWEQKSKPYKPRFHTAKIFFEENKLKENDSKLDNITYGRCSTTELIRNKDDQEAFVKTNPDLLKLRINELIHKNNSIVNCDDAVVIRRRNVDNYMENNNNNEHLQNHGAHWQQCEYRNVTDEPLNLTSKNRKRCLSDSDNTQKSLIKELLLKNLSADPNLQCPYCRMIFQTVTELEMHKLKYCNAKQTNIRYARSSSVNVASILTQNKNAFDNIPHMQHTTFPLKSPGPFLGKTRLIENDRQGEKYRTFSFDDNVIMHHTQSNSPSFNKYMLHSPVGTYPLSPQIKKPPIKLFGGEVKITQTSGETRSFKIESKNINKMEEPENFMDFSGSLSENLVIKSSLQSGGTVLQNKANYSPKMDNLPSPNIIRVYDNTDIVSPNLNLPVLGEKNKFNYDKIQQGNIKQNDRLLTVVSNEPLLKRAYSVSRDKVETNYIDNARPNNEIKLDNEKDNELYKSNLIDFGQKAVKLLAPNLKPPNLAIPGIPIPGAPTDKIYRSPTITAAPIEISCRLQERENFIDMQHLENLNFAKKQISLQQHMSEVSQPQNINLYNPMNLLVDGKVIRYVPGIPGPIAEGPTNLPMNTVISTGRLTPSSKYNREIPKSPRPVDDCREVRDKIESATALNGTPFERKTPTIIVDQHESRQNVDIKSHVYQNRIIQNNFRNNDKPPETINLLENKTSTTSVASSPEKAISKEESRKFVRPNSLALKPTSVSFKSHHGLTPTMFNQALISPDTPRIAKKYCQQYLNGNYFSYLGLKSSTKSVYCTLNKTQPFYVKHFKKLSMYSEWRQQESKIDSLSVTAYDSRQRQQKYTMAGRATADLIAHSSYKFVTAESSSSKEDSSNKNNSVLGGYESNEDYTYIRGRGRGRYVCDQCGIRCKKPSMLKKHIRTHSDDRPYTCEHCNFSFKTKGNLTKHMKSKAHSKKYAATSSTSTQNSVTTSSDSDESDAESSDESTRLQEHEAAHCLLSLAQKNNQILPVLTQDSNSATGNTMPCSSTAVPTLHLTEFPNFLKDDKFLKNPDQINQVTNANFAKNKILDESSISFNAPKHLTEVSEIPATPDTNNVTQYLGKSSTIRPLTYPYLQTQRDLENNKHDKIDRLKNTENAEYIPQTTEKYPNSAVGVSEIQSQRQIIKPVENKFIYNREGSYEQKFSEGKNKHTEASSPSAPLIIKQIVNPQVSMPVIRQNEFVMQNVEGNLPANIVFRKRKLSSTSSSQYKVQRSDGVVDLSVPVIKETPVLDLSPSSSNNEVVYSSSALVQRREDSADIIKINVTHPQRTLFINQEILSVPKTVELNNMIMTDQTYCITNDRLSEHVINYNTVPKPRNNSFSESNSSETFSQNSDTNDRVITKSVEICENSLQSDKSNEMYKSNLHVEVTANQSKTPDFVEQDQSAMQTLAEIAIKQVKLEKNILAKSVASEYLKLALNCDSNNSDTGLKKFVSNNKESVNELIVKPEENKNCSICSKNFSKPSQLRLHMNIHYLERPFRCLSCSVSFRTKGHLQKHERSASHHNKLSSSPALSSSEPRPFKCTDCNIAFRIHGHLAKHLRSKMHIMKLECLAKIPFGLYAELERANSLLTEINTTDGDLCLESLKILARKLFSNDPNKLDQLGSGLENRDS